MPTPHVVVVGGGFAGTACACALADRGLRVTLLERREALGGRAWSFPDPEFGAELDNGQHLVIGAYRQTLALLERLGTRSGIVLQDRLAVPLCDLRSGAHILVSARGVRGLPWREQAGLFRVLLALRGLGPQPDDSMSVADWLDRCRQSRRACELLWEPLAVATLNQEPRVASSALLAAVLKSALADRAAGARLGAARIGLSQLLAGVGPYLAQRGGTLRTESPVSRLLYADDRAAGVLVRGAEELRAHAVVLAVPPRALAALVPAFSELPARLGSSAIVSIHLGFDRPLAGVWLLGLVGSPIHWVFRVPSDPSRLCLVSSAADALAERDPDALVALALSELERALPLGGARLRAARVIKEHEATISHAVGTLARRPDVDSEVAGLFLAGDYTSTGLPATLEGAVQSGLRAAALSSAFARLRPPGAARGRSRAESAPRSAP
ncbi:MAG TPA: hydroxysqualene dehydroxylase HpnE [Polyangia bacterium]|nr:hydroxysqualene dehydroxylase HpnE [Polyangia bacterium]